VISSNVKTKGPNGTLIKRLPVKVV